MNTISDAVTDVTGSFQRDTIHDALHSAGMSKRLGTAARPGNSLRRRVVLGIGGHESHLLTIGEFEEINRSHELEDNTKATREVTGVEVGIE